MATAYTAGETLTAGQVVRLQAATDNTVELTDAITDKVIGIVAVSAASAATVIIDTDGKVSITVTGSVTQGDFLEPSTTSGSAQSASTTRTDGTFAIAVADDASGSVDAELLTGGIATQAGDVDGPASATDNAVMRADGTSGKVVQDSGVLIDDSDNVTGVVNLTTTGTVDISTGDINNTDGTYDWQDSTDSLALGGIGHNLTVGGVSIPARIALHMNSAAVQAEVQMLRHSDTAARGAVAYWARSRGSEGSETVVQDDDVLGQLSAVGFDGTDYEVAALIQMVVDGAPGAGDMPGRIEFYTTPDGSGTPVLRMTLGEDGTISFSNQTFSITNVNAGTLANLNTALGSSIADGAHTTTFPGLTDTPANFTGAAGQSAVVNSGETALEFAGRAELVFNGTSTLQAVRILSSNKVSTGPSTALIDGAPSGTNVPIDTLSEANWWTAITNGQLGQWYVKNSTVDDTPVRIASFADPNITLADTVPGTWGDGDTLTLDTGAELDATLGANIFSISVTDTVDTAAFAAYLNLRATDSGGAGFQLNAVDFHSGQAALVSITQQAAAIDHNNGIVELDLVAEAGQHIIYFIVTSSGAGTFNGNCFLWGWFNQV